jgi:hypothetical protein
MKKPILAFLIVSACAIPGLTLTAEGDAMTNLSAGCTPLKVIYAEKNWRDATPKDGRQVCRGGSRRGARATVQHFREYRAYRQIATMKCLRGSEGWFVPNPGSCATLACETTGGSGISWWAVNDSSGAQWVYQLLGGHTYPRDGYVRELRGRVVSGGPRPSSFHNRLINHEIAGTLGRSAWAC